MWLGAESVVAGCAGHRTVHKKSLGPDSGTKFAKKNDVCLHLLTTRLILIEVKHYKQKFYRPLDRSTVALQQTIHTVDIDTFHVQIWAIRS